ncbi:MAG: hypothetical protein A2V46_15940 [Bacteroidetes bacterium RBG_19FT_COMBO_42_7]|nr:MAG: hypothetical protein A2V46_15940 [Bacteroidetes bacterium RBG_19FT_COMBO_42_7]
MPAGIIKAATILHDNLTFIFIFQFEFIFSQRYQIILINRILQHFYFELFSCFLSSEKLIYITLDYDIYY